MTLLGAVLVVLTAVGVIGRAVVRRGPVNVPVRGLRVLASLSRADRRRWLLAMSAEIGAIEDPVARQRFAWGCLRAALVAPSSRDPITTVTQAVIGASVAGCVASAVFALVRYEAIREGRWTAVYVGVFAVTVVIYGVVGLELARLGSGRARRWALVLAAPALVTSTVAALGTGVLGAALGFGVVLLPGMAAYGAARVDGRWTSGFMAGMTCALIVGMLTFVGFTITIYVVGGGSPTDQMLQEFRRSGMADYAVWAIDDNLGGAVVMLALLPVIGGAFAAFGAQLGLGAPLDRPWVG